MSRRLEVAALLLVDALALASAVWAASAWSGAEASGPPGLVLAGIVGFGLTLFLFAGMYRERFAESRFDEVASAVKVITLGVLVLFVVALVDWAGPGAARRAALAGWAVAAAGVVAGRLVVRAVEKALLLRGFGVHRTVIVGWGDEVDRVYDEVMRYPAAGLQIVGTVRLSRSEGDGAPAEAWAPPGDGAFVPEPVLVPSGSERVGVPPVEHAIEALPTLIEQLGVQDVLVALGPGDHAYLDAVLRACDGQTVGRRPVTLKLVPDFHAAIGGMARTEHTYGLPLIELLPTPIPAWEQHTKRLIDGVTSALVLLAGLPLWLGIGLLVRLTSSGPAIYRQVRVGQHGRPFTMLKYRTMVDGAERTSGPVWARTADARITPLGAFLRRTRLDEVPQLWNVLRGDMSLVGPRPERPYFVERLAESIPLYARRHRVKPGITGLAQVKRGYDTDLEDVRHKLKYDLFYIEHMSLRMDFKVLLQTVRTTLAGRGR